MLSISVDMSYLFCEIDCRKDMWQNHFTNIVYEMLRIFTVNNVEKNFYVYKNKSKRQPGCADQVLVSVICVVKLPTCAPSMIY